MRKAFWAMLAAFALVYLLGEKSNPPPRTVEAAAPADVVGTTAEELFRMYDTNEVATDAALKGKIVEVKGVVQSITKDAWDRMYVDMKTPNQFMSAHMQVSKSQEQTLISMRKGQTVTVRCPQMKRWVGSPFGNDCVVMSAY
jgi:hypothetical protein